jgi:hypothetical protein
VRTSGGQIIDEKRKSRKQSRKELSLELIEIEQLAELELNAISSNFLGGGRDQHALGRALELGGARVLDSIANEIRGRTET